jgi:hypothetical protein
LDFSTAVGGEWTGTLELLVGREIKGESGEWP